jgi:hypothetical protein
MLLLTVSKYGRSGTLHFTSLPSRVVNSDPIFLFDKTVSVGTHIVNSEVSKKYMLHTCLQSR